MKVINYKIHNQRLNQILIYIGIIMLGINSLFSVSQIFKAYNSKYVMYVGIIVTFIGIIWSLKLSIRNMTLYLMLIILGIIINIKSESIIPLIFFLILIAAKQIQYRKVMLLLAELNIFYVIVHILLSIIFRIDDNRFLFTHNNIISYITMWAVIVLVLISNQAKYLKGVIIFITIIFLFFFTQSRTSAITIILFVILMNSKHLINIVKGRWNKWIIPLLPLILGIVSILLIKYCYVSKWASDIDSLFAGRFSLGNYFLNNYELCLLGQKVYTGLCTIWDSRYAFGRAYIDNLYLGFIIQYGIIFGSIWCILIFIKIKKSIYKREKVDLIVCILLCIYSLTETTAINILLCPASLILSDILDMKEGFNKND